jgi:hypothetical protein
MYRVERPKKELVREWLRQRRLKPASLPDGAEVRRKLGWKLIEPERKLPMS